MEEKEESMGFQWIYPGEVGRDSYSSGPSYLSLSHSSDAGQRHNVIPIPRTEPA
jgi:hypothetical protein